LAFILSGGASYGQRNLEKLQEKRSADGAVLKPADEECIGSRPAAVGDVTAVTNAHSPDCGKHDLSGDVLATEYSPQVLNAGEPTVSFASLATPKSARKAYARAVRLLRRKEPNKSVAELERAVQIYPRFAAAWYLLEVVSLSRGEIDHARSAFRNALEADPRNVDPYLPLVLFELKGRHFTEAAQLADDALRLEPNLAEAHYYRVVACDALGKIDCVGQSVRAIVEGGAERRYPGVHAVLGDIYAARGELGSAAFEYRRLMELEPASPMADVARRQLTEWQSRKLIQ
jgi:tetratricopeptide (TPR) repeat protein